LLRSLLTALIGPRVRSGHHIPPRSCAPCGELPEVGVFRTFEHPQGLREGHRDRTGERTAHAFSKRTAATVASSINCAAHGGSGDRNEDETATKNNHQNPGQNNKNNDVQMQNWELSSQAEKSPGEKDSSFRARVVGHALNGKDAVARPRGSHQGTSSEYRILYPPPKQPHRRRFS
jgi:hypothetical protein